MGKAEAEGASARRVPLRAFAVLFHYGFGVRALARMFGLSVEAVEARLRKALFR